MTDTARDIDDAWNSLVTAKEVYRAEAHRLAGEITRLRARVAELERDRDVALAHVTAITDACVYSDSYGVAGSDFACCHCCSGGGAPGVPFAHTDDCPVGKAEATAERWYTEHRDEIAEYESEENRLRAQNAALVEALRPLANAADAFDWVTARQLDADGVSLWGESSNIRGDVVRRITVRDAFAARAAIAATEGKQ